MQKKFFYVLIFLFTVINLWAYDPRDNQATVDAEWHDAKAVMIHMPGLETFFVSIMPIGSGFNSTFNLQQALTEFKMIIDSLEYYGVQVYFTNDIFLSNVIDSAGASIEGPKLYALQNFAKDFLSFDLSKLHYPLSINLTSYKTHIIGTISPQNLVNLIFLNPTIQILQESYSLQANNKLKSKFIVNPIVNFFYLNDLAINTKNGMVISHLTNPQRKGETKIFNYLLDSISIDSYFELSDSAKLEGGDFVAAGDVCFIGQGIRTNKEAIKQLIENKVFGTKRVIVVKDNLKLPFQMHLTKYFNFLNKNTVVLGENRMTGEDALKADVYVLDYDGEDYVIKRKDINFSDYMANNLGYTIIPVSMLDQEKLATDYFLIKENLIIGVQGVSNEFKSKLRDAGITAIWVNIENIKAGGGGIRSVIQVLKRKEAEKQPFLNRNLKTKNENSSSKGYISI